MALALIPIVAPGQQYPDAAEVLRRVSETYSKAGQYHLAGETTITVEPVDGDISEPVIQTFSIAMQEPRRVRLEMSTGDPDTNLHVVSDGTRAWGYFPARKEYRQLKLRPAAATASNESSLEDDDLVGRAILTARQALHRFRVRPGVRGRILREEKVAAAGRVSDCLVVSLPGQPSPISTSTWWVDKERYVVLREDSRNTTEMLIESSSTLYSTVRLDEQLPEALFTFVPPPGARPVN
jgi:outer membrane lipoprotein-sorting protein